MSSLLTRISFGSSDLRLLWCGLKLKPMESWRSRSDLSGALCMRIVIRQRNKSFRCVLLLGKSKMYRKTERIIQQFCDPATNKTPGPEGQAFLPVPHLVT